MVTVGQVQDQAEYRIHTTLYHRQHHNDEHVPKPLQCFNNEQPRTANSNMSHSSHNPNAR